MDLDLEVRVLVDHRDLVDAVGAREVPGQEARLRRIDLTGTGVVRAAVAGVEQPRSGGDEVEELELEVIELVRDEQPGLRRSVPDTGEQTLRAVPIEVGVPPPSGVPGVREIGARRKPHDDVNGDAAVVVEDRDVGLLVAVEIDGDRLHARDVEVVRALEEPLGVGELAIGAAVEHNDA